MESRCQDPQITATGKTLQDDLNHVIETQGNASGAMPGLPVHEEEILTHLDSSIKRLEAGIHAWTAGTGRLEA